MGAVYLATDQRLHIKVALKETFFKEGFLRNAFEREAALLAGLRHRTLPKVIDHFVEGQGQYLVMEYIEGDDVVRLLKILNRIPIREAMRWADELLDALEYLHGQEPPIIHRDIKPDNLKVTKQKQIILLDFGLSKGSTQYMPNTPPPSSLFGFTPNYAPLEQMNQKGTDARSDLYSLAATLYHLITGVIPQDALTRANAILNQEPDPLCRADELSGQVTPEIAFVLHKGMSLNRNERPLNATIMRQMLTKTWVSLELRDRGGTLFY